MFPVKIQQFFTWVFGHPKWPAFLISRVGNQDVFDFRMFLRFTAVAFVFLILGLLHESSVANAMEGQLKPKTLAMSLNQSEVPSLNQNTVQQPCQPVLPYDILCYLGPFYRPRDLVTFSKTNKFFYARLYQAFKDASKSKKWCLSQGNLQNITDSLDPLSQWDFYAAVSQNDLDILKIAVNCANDLPGTLEILATGILIAAHNDFEAGVKFLAEYSDLTLKECQELIPELSFPLTLELLLAAIYHADADELNNLLYSKEYFVCSANEDVIIKALVHVVKLDKTEHVRYLAQFPFALQSSDKRDIDMYCTVGLTYSWKHFGDTSFIKFLESLGFKKNELFVNAFVDMLFEGQHDLLLARFASFSEYFNTLFEYERSSELHTKWNLSPEALYYIASACNVRVFSFASMGSLEAFVTKKYSLRDSEALLKVGLTALPDLDICADEDTFLIAFIRSNYRTCGVLGIKEILLYFTGIHIPNSVKQSFVNIFSRM